jgi:prepilin-type N-terminal cleavage/methylation domain-containing protein
MNTHTPSKRNGLTLIELLTVMAVLVVLMALVIPQLRTVTKDRAAREAARIVGSTLNDASIKARVDGFAGIVIARNPNVTRNDSAGGNSINYAAFQMFQLRQPPSYNGNFLDGPGANVNTAGGVMTVTVPAPLDPNINLAGGFIKLNGTKTMYRITAAAGGVLTCDVPSHLEIPPNYMGVPFEVVRQPVLRQSSQVDLPRGFMINLNYSGAIDFDDSDADPWTWSAFTQNTGNDVDNSKPLYIIFDDQGGVDRIYPNGLDGPFIIPDSSIHFCVTTDEVKHSFQPNALSDAMLVPNPSDPLDDPSTMWVVINHLNGSVVATDNTPPATRFVAGDIPVANQVSGKKMTRMLESLTISGKRQSSRQ